MKTIVLCLLIAHLGIIAYSEEKMIKVVGELIFFEAESWHTQDLHIIGDDGEEEGIAHLDLVSPRADFKLIEPEKYKEIEFCIYFSSLESQSDFSELLKEFKKEKGIKVFSFDLPEDFLEGDFASIEADHITEMKPNHNKAVVWNSEIAPLTRNPTL